MPTHHKQTALRMLEQGWGDDQRHNEASALVQAQLETAAQMERIADHYDHVDKVVSEGIADFLKLLKDNLPAASDLIKLLPRL